MMPGDKYTGAAPGSCWVTEYSAVTMQETVVNKGPQSEKRSVMMQRLLEGQLSS